MILHLHNCLQYALFKQPCSDVEDRNVHYFLYGLFAADRKFNMSISLILHLHILTCVSNLTVTGEKPFGGPHVKSSCYWWKTIRWTHCIFSPRNVNSRDIYGWSRGRQHVNVWGASSFVLSLDLILSLLIIHLHCWHGTLLRLFIDCMSEEWPAVIVIYRYRSGSVTVTLADECMKVV